MFNSRILIPWSVICLAVFLSTGAVYASEPDGDGFTTLFNGKDLGGWQTGGNWLVQEGGLLGLTKPRGGRWGSHKDFIWTKKTYADFVLDLEYKIADGGNSGVFVRVRPPRSFIEVQIRDSHGKPEPLEDDDCGGVVYAVAPSQNMAKPAGQWNRMIITCNGPQMQVELNGEQIVDLELANSPMKSKPLSGYLGLQDYGHPVWFRNIRIKELN